MKQVSLIFILLIGFSCILSAQTVTIGSQVWMSKNLNVTNFRNGNPIPQAKTNKEWEKAMEERKPAWCYYDNDPKNGAKYGKLYNWYAVNDPRGLAPAGWHIPADAELIALSEFLGKDSGGKMKSTSGWGENGNGTNSTGFIGLPGGFRDFDGSFNSIGRSGFWWSASESGTSSAYFGGLFHDRYDLYRYFYSKGIGMSVRCLRD